MRGGASVAIALVVSLAAALVLTPTTAHADGTAQIVIDTTPAIGSFHTTGYKYSRNTIYYQVDKVLSGIRLRLKSGTGITFPSIFKYLTGTTGRPFSAITLMSTAAALLTNTPTISSRRRLM
jgi:hypothetical protein